MTEYEALRREIEIRLQRETIWRAVDAFVNKTGLMDQVERNDKTIAWIGEYLLALGNGAMNWEKFYKDKLDQEKK